MAILASACNVGDSDPLVYASLASQMADFLGDVPECVHIYTWLLTYALSAPGKMPWPATSAPIGKRQAHELPCTLTDWG